MNVGLIIFLTLLILILHQGGTNRGYKPDDAFRECEDCPSIINNEK